MTPTERLRKDVRKYADEVFYIAGVHRTNLQIAKQREEDIEVLNEAPRFFTRLPEALETEVMLSLSKLYEAGSDRRNLLKLVRFAYANRKDIDWESDPVTDEQMKEHKRLIQEQEPIVGKMISRRNQFYAHHDKEYFLNADELPDDYPLTLDEVERLIETAKQIVGDYYKAMKDKDISNLEKLIGKTDVSRVFQALGEFYLDGDYTLATED